jgi:hypothetical protein
LSVTRLVDIFSNKLETYIHTKIYAQKLAAALLIIAKTWKQSRYPSIDGWIYINRSIFIHWIEINCKNMEEI